MDDLGSYFSLTTYRRDGTGVETPVWFAGHDEKLYVFTDGTSYKVKRLRRDQRVRIARCDMKGKVTGPWHDGSCRIVEEPELIETAYAALGAKYGWQMTVVNLLSRLGGRIGRREILEITLNR